MGREPCISGGGAMGEIPVDDASLEVEEKTRTCPPQLDPAHIQTLGGNRILIYSVFIVPAVSISRLLC